MSSLFSSLWLYRIVRWVLAAIFIWAGISKLLEPGNFAVIIDEFGILPDTLLRPAAYALPVLECIAGVGLIFDFRGSLTLITALMFLFTGVLIYGIWQGVDADCGCFGMYEPETSLFRKLKPALARDIVMLGIIAYLYWSRWKQKVKKLENNLLPGANRGGNS